MTQKYVAVGNNNVVSYAFDDPYHNDIPTVRTDANGEPLVLHPITDIEYSAIVSGDYNISDFTLLTDGTIQLRLEAEETYKETEVQKLDASIALKTFARVMLDEINLLRNELGLQPRTVNQLKTAMKNKI